MTEPDAPTCPGIGNRTCTNELLNDGTLCWTCIDIVRADLDTDRGLPGLERELATTTAKLDRINAGQGVAGKLDGTLPLNLGAVAARNHARLIVGFTCALGYEPTEFTVTACVDAVLADINRLRTHVDGPAFAAAITKAAADWRYTIDPSSDRVYAGFCRCTDAGTNLYARADAETVRCRSCGADYDVEFMLTKLDAILRDTLVTPADIREHQAARVSADQIRQWRRRGNLRPVIGPWGAKLYYRFGDVLDLIDRLHAVADPTTLSVAEVAKLLDVSDRNVRKQCAAGTMPARRVNGAWRINATELHNDAAERINA